MPDPAALIAVARRLIDDSQSKPSDEQLRRAVSTAYYAMFHLIVRAAASRFMGPGQDDTAGYTLIYRSFDHRRMREVFTKLSEPRLDAGLRKQLRRNSISQDMRDFATEFPGLQVARHHADYDPVGIFEVAEVADLIASVEYAMAAFDRVDPSEKTDILALLMLRPRA